MNVYPFNLASRNDTTSNVLSYSDIKNVYHPYMKNRAYFDTHPIIDIFTHYSAIHKVNSIIIADTDCDFVSIKAYRHDMGFNGVVWETEKNLKHDEFIHIFRIELDDDKVRNINHIEFKFYKNVFDITHITHIGYIYVGPEINLPRFVVNPEYEIIIRGESNRTDNGQAYGTILPTLNRFSAQFLRIFKNEKIIIDDYIQAVQTSIPHVIDPYPGAHEDFPPFYATLSKGITAVKRNEDNFYWNFSLEWLEAN